MGEGNGMLACVCVEHKSQSSLGHCCASKGERGIGVGWAGGKQHSKCVMVAFMKGKHRSAGWKRGGKGVRKGEEMNGGREKEKSCRTALMRP